MRQKVSFQSKWRYYLIIKNVVQKIILDLVYKWFLLYTHFLEIIWENLIGEARPELEKCRFQ